jgi:hypothetical protein
MSADPVGEPVRRTDDDVLGRLAAIDHRLHQISNQLATMSKSLSQLDEICAHLCTDCSWTIRLTGASPARLPGTGVFEPRWRPCRAHAKANLCLHQTDDVLESDMTPQTGRTGDAAAPTPTTSPDQPPTAGDGAHVTAQAHR